MSKHADINIGQHSVRVVFDVQARGGSYSPELHFHLTGPNGSPNGRGPKHWPTWMRRIFVGQPYDFGGMLTVRIPHIHFHYPMNKVQRWAYRHNQHLMYKLAK